MIYRDIYRDIDGSRICPIHILLLMKMTSTIVILGSCNIDLITYCDEFPNNGGKLIKLE